VLVLATVKIVKSASKVEAELLYILLFELKFIYALSFAPS